MKQYALIRAFLAGFAMMTFLMGCVSSKLAEANQRSVEALASAAVMEDEGNAQLADESVTTAADIVDATATLTQIANLGVSTDLTERNFQNVQELSAAVTGTTEPRVASLANRAQDQAGELAGKSRGQKTFVRAAKSSPIGGWVTEILGILGGAGAAIYGGTRGRKHLTRWWNEPGKTIPENPPNSDAAA